jgi:hypothetical protein
MNAIRASRALPTTALEAALEYIDRGWAPIPIPWKSKNPGKPGWEKQRFTTESARAAFAGTRNIGLITGQASGGLTDLDLDTPEALALADEYALPTNRKHGRPGAPHSHRWYVAPGASSHKFEFTPSPGHDKDKRWTFLEIRADGGKKADGTTAALQTVVPPSVHPSGERYAWELARDCVPTQVDASELERTAGLIAAGALLARLWPAMGHRDKAAMALAGWLLLSGWDVAAVDRFTRAVARAAGDEEERDRAKGRGTQEAIERGDNVTGKTRLAELLGADGPQACAKVAEWLGLRAIGATQSQLGGDAGVAADPPPDPTEADRRNSAEKSPTIAARLVKIAEEYAALWHDADGTAWATVTAPDGHHENWPLAAKAFKRWLSRAFYVTTGQNPGAQPLADALLTLEGRAAHDGPQCAVYTRLAEHEGAIYLDLADEAWRAVKISPAGWEIVSESPVRFRRAKGMLPLPVPTRGGSLQALRQFVNVADKNAWPLVIAWLVAALRPVGPYPVLALSGEMGSAKTTLARLLRALVDPNAAPVRSAPRDERDLAIAANNGWVIALDNLSHVPGWLSDALCRLSTGGGFATRTLYENDEETIFAAQRPIIFTGIEEVATRGDLVDRALLLALEPIPDEKRLTEAALWRDFEAQRPAILGALLDMVSGALARLPHINLARKPRMADFAEWAIAAEGVKEGNPSAFLDAYEANRKGANEVALEASPVAEQLLKFAEKRDEWEGKPSELYDELTALAGEKIAAGASWPRNARALSGALKRLAPNLRRAGIAVILGGRTGDARGSRITRIEKVEKVRNFASDASDASEKSASAEMNGAEATRSSDASSDANQSSDATLTQTGNGAKLGTAYVSDASDASDAKLRTLASAASCQRPMACARRQLASGRVACGVCDVPNVPDIPMIRKGA